MVSLGETITIKANKHQTRYMSADGRFSICTFTARKDMERMPQGLKLYGTTVFFLVRGRIPESENGVSFYLTGSWEKNPKAKSDAETRIFEVTKATIVLPEEEKQITSFLAKHSKGVGVRMAEKVTKTFGKDTLCVCANDPGKVMEVTGIPASVAYSLQKTCNSLITLSELQSLVGKVDISPEVLERIVDVYGKDAVQVAKRDAYQFINCSGVGFANADKIAIACGEPRHSRRRIKAGLEEAARVVCQKTGCMCAETAATLDAAVSILGPEVRLESIQTRLSEMLSEYELVKQGAYIYNREDFIAERGLARQVAKFVRCPASDEEKIEAAFQQWQTCNQIQLSAKQSEAVRNLKFRLSIVTGGPGTGKTTTLRAIMDVYHSVFPSERILLMAPTGLAAKRMSESTGELAATIHSACGLIPANNGSGFTAQEGCTIDAGFIGIDETSMVGEHLFDFAMGAIQLNKNTRIVLLGDVDQLAPVARGDVLRDLIQCGMVPTTVLDCNYRQGNGSTITDASVKIRQDQAFVGTKSNLVYDDQFAFVPIEPNPQDVKREADTIMDALVEEYQAEVKRYGVKGTIILTATHYDRGKVSGYLSKDAVNRVIQDKVNPADADKPSCKVASQVFRVGDRVIQRKNTDTVINGDLGTIVSIEMHGGDTEVLIDFDSRAKPLCYDIKSMKNVELAYAITVHSSQGCEFPCCIIPVSMSYSVMLTRAVYYTAITRAKKRVTLIGDEKALARAINNKRRTSRKSLLGPRIIKKVQNPR